MPPKKRRNNSVFTCWKEGTKTRKNTELKDAPPTAPPTTQDPTTNTRVWTTEMIPLDPHAFCFKKDGVTIRGDGTMSNGSAGSRAKSRSILRMIDYFKNQKASLIMISKLFSHFVTYQFIPK